MPERILQIKSQLLCFLKELKSQIGQPVSSRRFYLYIICQAIQKSSKAWYAMLLTPADICNVVQKTLDRV